MSKAPGSLETIEVEEISAANRAAIQRWQPSVGAETTKLFTHLKQSGRVNEEVEAQIISQATRILGCCVPSHDPGGKDIGLVIGHVQSGKTMSFTTVATLARDNGYQIVIVLTGISKPLFRQSASRLKKDLHISDEKLPNREWLPFENPSPKGDSVNNIRQALERWQDPKTSPTKRRTLLITVMKNVTHLRNLIRVSQGLQSELDGVPVLVVDDEADQASLNNAVNKNSQSPTYREILELREAIPHHSFLQYTATPQAPLLINLIDTLSPNFAQVLVPGEDYTGGKTFFENCPYLILPIPEDELPTRDTVPEDVPDSLKEAMRFFYLGVAASEVQDSETGNRSMMVHPAVHRESHRIYKRWVEDVSQSWKAALGLPDDDPDKRGLLLDFRDQYNSLTESVKDLPDFSSLAANLHEAIAETRIVEVNTRRGQTPNISWNERYPWILVGGAALDRGFTVEGLTVTYMPRQGGLGNADTIQQRARFFGYKRRYLGYCRVYLPESLQHQYKSYVIHEEDVHRQLIRHMRQGKPLNSWKRAFLLDQSLRPTRDSVLDLDYFRVKNYHNTWFTPQSPHRPTEAIDNNRQLILNLTDGLSFEVFKADPRVTKEQTHERAYVSLRTAYEECLTHLSWGKLRDSTYYTGLLVLLANYLESHPDAKCTVYRMSCGEPRKRGLTSDAIKNLFQGSNAPTGYPGDREVYDDSNVTIQIHRLEITQEIRQKSDAGTAFGEPHPYKDVYTVALRIGFAYSALVQKESLDD